MSFALEGRELIECKEIASRMIRSEPYLSGAEVEFLEEVISGEIFDARRLIEITSNHGFDALQVQFSSK
jgi:hypothetical protein